MKGVNIKNKKQQMQRRMMRKRMKNQHNQHLRNVKKKDFLSHAQNIFVAGLRDWTFNKGLFHDANVCDLKSLALTSMSFRDIHVPFLSEMKVGSLYFPLINDWFSIKCHLLITCKKILRLGTDGLYCVTKGINLLSTLYGFYSSADLLSVNLTSARTLFTR